MATSRTFNPIVIMDTQQVRDRDHRTDLIFALLTSSPIVKEVEGETYFSPITKRRDQCLKQHEKEREWWNILNALKNIRFRCLRTNNKYAKRNLIFERNTLQKIRLFFALLQMRFSKAHCGDVISARMYVFCICLSVCPHTL